MLSKLRHTSAKQDLTVQQCEELCTSLKAVLGDALSKLRPQGGGTLGVCFKGEFEGNERFFKTHAIPDGYATLKREYTILNFIWADSIDALLLQSGHGDTLRAWLNMYVLEENRELSPEAALSLISEYDIALNSFTHSEIIPHTDNIHLVLSESLAGLQFLHKNKKISNTVFARADEHIKSLQYNCRNWPLQICHGDLGPANIMTNGHALIAIDWEDAFWGVAGYDYLYWLTFFTNRKWLSPSTLGHSPWGRSNEVSLLVAILTLKCFLTLRDGTHQNNRISFDQRLLEAMNLE